MVVEPILRSNFNGSPSRLGVMATLFIAVALIRLDSLEKIILDYNLFVSGVYAVTLLYHGVTALIFSDYENGPPPFLVSERWGNRSMS